MSWPKITKQKKKYEEKDEKPHQKMFRSLLLIYSEM